MVYWGQDSSHFQIAPSVCGVCSSGTGKMQRLVVYEWPESLRRMTPRSGIVSVRTEFYLCHKALNCFNCFWCDTEALEARRSCCMRGFRPKVTKEGCTEFKLTDPTRNWPTVGEMNLVLGNQTQK